MNKVKVKMNEGIICIMNLADIPHGKLIGSKDFDDGRHIDFYKAIPGTQVIAYDEATGEAKWVDISGWSKHTGSFVELVQLSNGETITTDNDPRAVYGISINAENLQLSRETPSNALENHYIVPIQSDLPETTELFNAVDFINGGIPSRVQNSAKNGILSADYQLGQFIGLMAGDGWWDKKAYNYGCTYQFHLADLEGNNATWIKSWLENLGISVSISKYEFKKEEYEDRFGDTVRWSFYFDGSEYWCKSLANMLGGERDETTAGSGNKHLPFWFMSMSKEFRYGLLNGIIATDGSISLNTSGNRSHAELVIQFSSTSRRLIDDVKALCASLGIRSTVSFSKVTVRGNISWILGLSTIDCKRNHIFDNCCNTKKRETFLQAEVSDVSTANKGDIIPFTYQVSSAVNKYLTSRTKIAKAVIDSCELLPLLKRGASLYQSVKQYKDKGYITRDFSSRFCAWCEDYIKMSFWFNDYINAFQKRLLSGEKEFPVEEVNTLSEAINFNKQYFPKDKVLNALALSGRLRQKGVSFPTQLVTELNNVILNENAILFDPINMDPIIKQWIELSVCDVKWVFIERVDKTKVQEEGYDLTVPGYETFASSTGVILSNTMTYYVPVSDKAVKEAYKLMTPSANQLSARDFTALPELQEELVSGAFLASHKKNTPPKKIFDTRAEAMAAYRRGEIDVDDNVVIRSEQ